MKKIIALLLAVILVFTYLYPLIINYQPNVDPFMNLMDSFPSIPVIARPQAVAISCTCTQNLYGVPGDSHVASLLGMTEITFGVSSASPSRTSNLPALRVQIPQEKGPPKRSLQKEG